MEIFLATLALMLAIGAALDQVIKLKSKDILVSYIQNFDANKISPAAGLSNFVDLYAGKKIFSIRSFLISAVLTTVSIIFMSSIFIMTSSESFIISKLGGFSITSGVTALIVFICIILMYLGDYFSFSQTRLFMNVSNKYINFRFAVLMLLADIVCSAAIFIVMMTAVRLFAYVMLCGFAMPDGLQTKYSVVPQAVAPSIAAIGVDERAMKFSADRGIMLRDLYVLYRSGITNSSTLEKIANIHYRKERNDILFGNSLSLSAEKDCMSYNPEDAITDQDIYAVSNNTFKEVHDIVYGSTIDIKSIDQSNVPMRKIIKEILKSYNPNANCQIPVITIKKKFIPIKFIRDIGLGNMFLASFEMTLDDTVKAIPRKFSEYVAINPSKDFIKFIQESTIAKSAIPVVGYYNDRDVATIIYRLSEYQDISIPGVDLPFSILQSAAMTPSVIFFIYLFLWFVSRILGFAMLYIGNNLIHLGGNKYIFTFLSMTAIFVTVVLSICWMIIDISWSGMLSLLG